MAVKVTKISQLTTFEGGEVKNVYQVEWRVGDDGPFFDMFPVDDFNEIAIKQKLEERAAKLATLRDL